MEIFFRIKILKFTLLSILCGLGAGILSYLFLNSLDFVTNFRVTHNYLIYLLPLAGLMIGILFSLYGKESDRGSALILDEIHNPKKIVPFRLVPFVFIGSVLTHLCGGSAGREGALVQMAAALADQFAKLFNLIPSERKRLLIVGLAAGFGSAVGAPIAGAIFGMEVLIVGKLSFFIWYEALIASSVGYFVVKLLGVSHIHYLKVIIPFFSWENLFYVFLAGIIFGVAAKVFASVTHFIEHQFKKITKYPFLRPVLGGTILLVFFLLFDPLKKYQGLGIESIEMALNRQSSFLDPILKIVITSLTIGSGFKGGEFIPLVFIGSTLGSALSLFIPISTSFLAVLGFVATFGAAANTPLTCTIMAMELFGYKIGIYALIACYSSYYFSGHTGIYKSQLIYKKKWVINLKK